MILKTLRHRTERNEVYTFVMPGRVYRVIGDLYQTLAMYSFDPNRVNAFEQAEYAGKWLGGVRCDG